MKIEHIALWVKDLEGTKSFYESYFGGKAGEKYTNAKKQFTSYFLEFGPEGCRIELMNKAGITDTDGERGFAFGLAHLALYVESREEVNKLTERLRKDQFIIASEPRVTGDGYFESAILDPEGNYVEICSK